MKSIKQEVIESIVQLNDQLQLAIKYGNSDDIDCYSRAIQRLSTSIDLGAEQPKPNTHTEADFVEGFNMWLDDFVNNPQKFETLSNTIIRHLVEKLGGKQPSYGEVATATLFEYCNKAKSENN